MRAKDKRTVERQLAVIADFFAGDLSQAAILTKHRVSTATYRAWQFDTGFTEEVERRIASAHRESAAIIAWVAATAALRLIKLTKSPKEDIARKACLDIIAMGRRTIAAPRPPQETGDQQPPPFPGTWPLKCSRCLRRPLPMRRMKPPDQSALLHGRDAPAAAGRGYCNSPLRRGGRPFGAPSVRHGGLILSHTGGPVTLCRDPFRLVGGPPARPYQ